MLSVRKTMVCYKIDKEKREIRKEECEKKRGIFVLKVVIGRLLNVWKLIIIIRKKGRGLG